MDTKVLSPGVYVRDVKPTSISYDPESISNGLMFAQCTFDAPNSIVDEKNAVQKPVRLTSFSDFASNFGGGLFMVRFLMSQQIGWSGEQNGAGPGRSRRGSEESVRSGVPTIPNSSRREMIGKALEFVKAINEKEDEVQKNQMRLESPPKYEGGGQVKPRLKLEVADMVPLLATQFGLETVNELEELVQKLEPKEPESTETSSPEGSDRNPPATTRPSASPGGKADTAWNKDAAAIATTLWSVYGFFLNGGKVLNVYNVKRDNIKDALTNPAWHKQVTLPDVDAGLIMAPGVTDKESVKAMKTFAGKRDGIDADGEAFCFAIFDVAGPESDLEDVTTDRAADFGDHSSACYWPWLEVGKTNDGEPIVVPPSAFMAGAIAGTDGMYGPHIAAAGESKSIKGAIGLTQYLNDTDAGTLNGNNINCLRRFPGGEPLIWGARTLTTDPYYKYIPVARQLLQIRKTLKKQTRSVIFKPNTPGLRKSLKTSIYQFLEGLRKKGALDGESPQDAFKIVCDESNNSADDVINGRLNVLVAVKPVRVTEFVIIDVTQFLDTEG